MAADSACVAQSCTSPHILVSRCSVRATAVAVHCTVCEIIRHNTRPGPAGPYFRAGQYLCSIQYDLDSIMMSIAAAYLCACYLWADVALRNALTAQHLEEASPEAREHRTPKRL
jgi:hypothetical protein